MNALLILAHGSRKKESNQEIIALAKKIEKIAAEFAFVRCAFLQFALPTFEEQVQNLVDKGATEIMVFPYFISSGSHVVCDIPQLVAQARAKHPQVHFMQAFHLGKLPGIEKFIVLNLVNARNSYVKG